MAITLRLLITLMFMVALLIASVIPGRFQAGDSVFVWVVATTPSLVQNVLHVCLYAILTTLWAWTLEALESVPARLFVALTLAVGFGALMEWFQTSIPGRFGTFYDVMLNTVGATIGLLVATRVFK